MAGIAETKTLDMPPDAVATVWTMLFSCGPNGRADEAAHFLRTEKPTMDYREGLRASVK